VEEDGRPALTGNPTDPAVEPVAWQVVEPAPPVAGEHLAATIAALADPATRSPRPDTCPFLRTIAASGAAAAPVEIPDAANRCVAVGSPTPQSSRQQQLVCLTSGHGNCPLYLRGTLIAGDAIAAAPPRRGPSAAIVGSILVLIAAAAMSVGFLLVRGGFDLPAVAVVPSLPADGGGGAPSPTAAAIATPVATSPAASVVESPSAAAPTTAPTPSASPAPATPSPATPAPTPARTPVQTPATGGTAARYALLVKCQGTPNCWIYTVRSGDNFRSIVNWFGVPYDTVLRMNPQIGNPTTIRAGDRIRMPPPTR